MTDQTAHQPPTDQQLDDDRAEIAKLVRWHREDGAEMDKQRAAISRLRARASELEVGLNDLAALVSQWHDRAKKAEARVAELEGALTEIRHLHKDSPMGPCPVCIDADAAAAGGDGLVPYPCPTGRLAGAQDCDPPPPAPVAAVVSSAAGTPGSAR
ncbi:hypothetical protein ACFXKI_00840 [Streptomyces mirabilis]|uniref:hypothetical protein n=1 Tax=Streptomyces mirabilis TaxID=68239 RepID=UPI00367F0BA5